MQIVTINEAEAILSPFWDKSLSDLNQWNIDPVLTHALKVYQEWCWVAFEWVQRPVDGPTLRMSRQYCVDCTEYDRLLLSVMTPKSTVVRLLAETDCGLRLLEASPIGLKKQELVLELEGATQLYSVTIEIEAGADGIASGWFNWLGLQHSGRLEHMLMMQTVWDANWQKHLKEESFEPSFTPAYGLVLNAWELAALREWHSEMMKDGRSSPFIAAAEAAARITPESLIHEHVNFWFDSRYNRERDHDKFILNHGMNAAIAGHLLRDKSLLRLAARYAMSIGMCKNWHDGFICHFPGGVFEHRCFVQSLCAYEVACILDLAGEYFTDTGRDFLLRRLAEEAIGAIQFNTWRHSYIFSCNQLAWFTSGRILALGVLQCHWPRVRPYLDIAYQELCESLDRIILPDGGYAEGPAYFLCVGRDASMGIYYYSRAVGRPMAEFIPKPMKHCGNFADVLISTDDTRDVISICDGGDGLHDVTSQAIMADLLPGSAWVHMLIKTLARNMGWLNNDWSPISMRSMTDAAITWSVIQGMQSTSSKLRTFVDLPVMGPLASHRCLGGEMIKIFIQGNQAGAGHTHEDKGSFVLEFAGETFAVDPGSCDYGNPLSDMLTRCERHNMLVPYGTPERPHPANPLPYDVKPHGNGDDTAFHAEIDATPGWNGYYHRWFRTWDSPTPDVLTIMDEYELTAGDGVEFYWQTLLPVTMDGRFVTITGVRGCVKLEAPEGCVWRLEDLPLLNGVQHRLSCRYTGISGTAIITVYLELNN